MGFGLEINVGGMGIKMRIGLVIKMRIGWRLECHMVWGWGLGLDVGGGWRGANIRLPIGIWIKVEFRIFMGNCIGMDAGFKVEFILRGWMRNETRNATGVGFFILLVWLNIICFDA